MKDPLNVFIWGLNVFIITFIIYVEINAETETLENECKKRVIFYHTDLSNDIDYLGNKIYTFCLGE